MQDWQMMAADRLTQLQDAVNLQAENFCNSIGTLQMLAKQSPFTEFNLAKVLNHNNETTNDLSSGIKNDQNKSSTQSTGSSNNKSNKSINGTSTPGTSSSSITTTNDEQQKDEQNGKSEDNSQLLARVIARTAKDIDTLIESLPPTFESESGSPDFYSASIRQLEDENSQCIKQLEDVIKRGENMLQMIQAALDEIAFMQLNTPSPNLHHQQQSHSSK